MVDTTGAGDCFNAVFLSGLVKGLDLVEAANYANAAAALSIQHVGARAGLPTEADTRSFLVAEYEAAKKLIDEKRMVLMSAVPPKPNALSQIFERPKPLIGTIHCLPFPGSPQYKGEDLEIAINHAVEEAVVHEEGRNGWNNS